MILTAGGDRISRNEWWLGICKCVVVCGCVCVHDYTACFMPYVPAVFTLKEPSAARMVSNKKKNLQVGRCGTLDLCAWTWAGRGCDALTLANPSHGKITIPVTPALQWEQQQWREAGWPTYNVLTHTHALPHTRTSSDGLSNRLEWLPALRTFTLLG